MTIVEVKRILVVVAHSDDEALGMGGVIKRHVEIGDLVSVVCMTDGVSARDKDQTEKALERKKSSVMSSKILGFKWENQHSFDDNAMDKYPLLDIIKCIEASKVVTTPDIVYSHSGSDLNVDHRVVAKAVLTAFRPQPNEKCSEIRLFEVPSATDYGHENVTGSFTPNLFIDITDTWAAKEAALNAYKGEMKEYPHSRSIEGSKNLAMLRGNQVGLRMAEAFQVIRKIER